MRCNTEASLCTVYVKFVLLPEVLLCNVSCSILAVPRAL